MITQLTPDQIYWATMLAHLRFLSLAILMGAMLWTLLSEHPSLQRTIRLLLILSLLAINFALVMINVNILGLAPV